jgi:hypothetical protein
MIPGIAYVLIFSLILCRCSVGSISICSSTVFVGVDQRAENFHTDSFISLDTDVKYFCAKHGIYDIECEAIRQFHTKRCFSEENKNRIDETELLSGSADQSETETRVENSSDDGDDMISAHSQEDKSNTENLKSEAIDYSQSYGPTLPVTLVDKTHQLKVYYMYTHLHCK